jgi:tetratricopeptide (TPR) repeat protein
MARGRYDLHPIVQQFGRSCLADEAQLAARVGDSHCAYYLGLLARREDALKSAAQEETIEELTGEINNIRAAWKWAVEKEKFDLLCPALRCFGLFFDVRGWSQDGIEQADLVLQALRERVTGRERQMVFGQTLALQGLFLFRLGDHYAALCRLEGSLKLLRPLGKPTFLVDPLVLSGIIHFLMGDLERARAYLAEGLAYARESGDRWSEAYALFNQGGVDGLFGSPEEGYRKMSDAIALWRAVGDPRFIALGLNFISPVAIRLGKVDEAQVNLEEALALSSQVGDRWMKGTAYRFLGTVALARGNPREAQGLIERSLEVFEGFVSGWDVVTSLIQLGEAYGAADDISAAGQCFLEALHMAVDAGAIPLALDALVGLAHIDIKNGEVERALTLGLFAVDHPACADAAAERARRLLAMAEEQLEPETVDAIRSSAASQSLEDLMASLPRTGPDSF